MFTPAQIAAFHTNGFMVARQLATRAECEKMLEVVLFSINPPLAPLEFETDVQYPGAPTDRLSPGGDTPRRLLHAYTRDAVFRDWATASAVVARVKQLLDTDALALSQNHHNCIMTKHPGFSSATMWHQDIRYWLFDRPQLVNVWLALGDEHRDNGGLQLIPGSHRHSLARGCFDGGLFLRQDLADNRQLIATAQEAKLARGDALFFHSQTLHAAGRNNTSQMKISVVFSYRAGDNQPLAGTRSAAYADLVC